MVNDSNKQNILITGGSGFIGSNVKKKLSELDFKVLTVGRNKNEDFTLDLTEENLKNIVQDFLPEVICHFASGSNIARAAENIDKEYKDTVSSTESLVKTLTKLKSKPVKIIYLSSQAVYGLPNELPVSENHSTKPITVYGKNKLQAENIIIQSKLDYLIFRVSSVFGPSQDYNKSGVIAKFINKMKKNEPPIVFNSFDLISDLIYIDDLVLAIILSIQCDLKNQILNLGSGKPTTLKQILGLLYKFFPQAPEAELQISDLYPNKQQKGLYLNIEKVQSHLKWAPQYSVEKGLKKMLKSSKPANRV